MALDIELRLMLIECIKTNESEDQLFCSLDARFADKSTLGPNRFPTTSPNYWKMANGQVIGPNLALFNGEFEQQLQLNLKFYEDDSLGFLTFTNDLIGSMTLEINEDKNYHWNPDTKTTTFIEKTPDGIHVFEMKGSKALYKIRLKLLQKVVI